MFTPLWLPLAGSFQHGPAYIGAGLPGQQVTSLFEDRAGNMWVMADLIGAEADGSALAGSTDGRLRLAKR